MIKKYAVIGNPIAQSRSPEIHLLFAQQFNHDIEYSRIETDAANFEQTLKSFIAAGGLGMNVTAPFKLAAANFANSLSARATSAQAVNTLIFKPHKCFGDNTDGIGLAKDIEVNLQQPIKGCDILLIGAGGAARGVLLPLLEAQPKSLLIINRTAAKASALAALMPANNIISAGDLNASSGLEFDIVINATSAGLSKSNLPPVNYSFKAQSLAYDLVYSKNDTPFMLQAQAAGADKISDGFGMLVEQAAYSYRLWHGVMPNTQLVLQQLRP